MELEGIEMNVSSQRTIQSHSTPMELIIQIETAFDSFDRELFEFKILSSRETIEAQYWTLYLMLWDQQYDSLFELSQLLLNETNDVNLKAFVIQAAVAACENLFDLTLRENWLKKWNNFENLPEGSYAHYLYLYHKANGLYFSHNKNDSIKLWQRSLLISQNLHYHRGEFRLKFFLGLVQQELGFFGSAQLYFEDSLKMAKQFNAIRFIERILSKLNSIQDEGKYFFNSSQREVFDYIKKNQIKRAKRCALNFCRIRRSENRQWGADSEWMLLSWVAFAEQKLSRFFKLLDLMDNDHIKWRSLQTSIYINSDLALNSTQFQHYLKMYKLTYEIDSEQLAKENINSVSNTTSDKHEVISLINLLKNYPSGITKEFLCTQLWNYRYDPFIHDQRIYIIISKARKLLGSRNSINNVYGGVYKINNLLL